MHLPYKVKTNLVIVYTVFLQRIFNKWQNSHSMRCGQLHSFSSLYTLLKYFDIKEPELSRTLVKGNLHIKFT